MRFMMKIINLHKTKKSVMNDNGVKSKETIILTPGEIKTELLYDESGAYSGKIEYRGAVTTWFDKDNSPCKREIDRGLGGIITESL